MDMELASDVQETQTSQTAASFVRDHATPYHAMMLDFILVPGVYCIVEDWTTVRKKGLT